MRGRRPAPFQLTPKAEELLRRLANNPARPFLTVLRARILLARASGMRIKCIVDLLHVDASWVWRVTKAFERRGIRSLEPKVIPGKLKIPARFQTFADRPEPESKDDDLHEVETLGLDWG